MASIKPLTQADRRPLSGANRSREPIAFAAESDPLQHLAIAKYRIAKGSNRGTAHYGMSDPLTQP